MYARRHFLIRNEVAILRLGGKGVSTKEATSLLLFSIILESNEEDLIYAMMQEGAHKVIRDMMKEFPSLNKRYPILAAFTNKFWRALRTRKCGEVATHQWQQPPVEVEPGIRGYLGCVLR